MASDVSLVGANFLGAGGRSADQGRGMFGGTKILQLNPGGNGIFTGFVNNVTIDSPSLLRLETITGVNGASPYLNGDGSGFESPAVWYDAPGPRFDVSQTGLYRQNAYSRNGAYLYFPVPGVYAVYVGGQVSGSLRATGLPIQGTLFMDVDPLYAQMLMGMDPASGTFPAFNLTVTAATTFAIEPLANVCGSLTNCGLRLHTVTLTNVGANPCRYNINGIISAATVFPLIPAATATLTPSVTLTPAQLCLSTLAVYSALGTTLHVAGSFR
jgi:hypothetical protein